MLRFFIVLAACFCMSVPQLSAQVESYGRDPVEEAPDSIKPSDTATVAPKFEDGDNDFLRYLETHFNTTLYKNQLKPMGDLIQFEISISKTGEVDEFQVLSSTNFSLNDPMQDVLYSMPKWKPGTVGGKVKKVKMVYTLKIRSSDTAPFIQIDKEKLVSQYDPSTRHAKAFLIAGSLLIFAVLILKYH